MIKTTTYNHEDLTSGICSSCGQESSEILKSDGRCVDCIEADLFYEMTMEGLL